MGRSQHEADAALTESKFTTPALRRAARTARLPGCWRERERPSLLSDCGTCTPPSQPFFDLPRNMSSGRGGSTTSGSGLCNIGRRAI